MFLRCPICNQLLERMTPGHTKKHGMELRDYLDKYPQFRAGQFEYGVKFKRPESETINSIDRWKSKQKGGRF